MTPSFVPHMLAGVPSDDGHGARLQCCGILTMQMRHLYRSPLSICLSSSLIRAFRASMVVAVDSSSVTLRGRQEKERQGRKRLVLTPDDAVHLLSFQSALPQLKKMTLFDTYCMSSGYHKTVNTFSILDYSVSPSPPKISCLDYQQTAQTSSVFQSTPHRLSSSSHVPSLHSCHRPLHVPAPERPLINARHDNGECAFNTVRQNMKRR